MSRQPSLFLSHGSPMLPLEPGTAGPMLASLAGSLKRPRSILAFSPHWITRAPMVGASERPETIHDFGGFDPSLYTLDYPAPGDLLLARRVKDLLEQADIPVGVDPDRGLDHGVWIPLRVMFAKADIPVVPLAMPWPLDPRGAYRLGAAVGSLASEGVLLLASGSLTHNLGEFRANARVDQPAEPYVIEFAQWIRRTIEQGDIDALLDYRRQAPHAVRAHPTDEHLLPLFWALGAAGPDAKPEYLFGGVHYGMLSMDALAFSKTDRVDRPATQRLDVHLSQPA